MSEMVCHECHYQIMNIIGLTLHIWPHVHLLFSDVTVVYITLHGVSYQYSPLQHELYLLVWPHYKLHHEGKVLYCIVEWFNFIMLQVSSKLCVRAYTLTTVSYLG